jgi:hypothetical protein
MPGAIGPMESTYAGGVRIDFGAIEGSFAFEAGDLHRRRVSPRARDARPVL